jgi:hypothetical protein
LVELPRPQGRRTAGQTSQVESRRHGTLDDVIVTKEHDIFIPVQVGGFLGVGSRLVVLPFDAFKIDDRKIVLPNASKEQLKKLADFKYVS